MANLIQFPTGYFPRPDSSLAIANGEVYIGTADTDPTIEGNRITVTLVEEDGTEVTILPASQPLELGMGGVFMYDGSPVQVFADTNYAMTVLSSDGAQQYYFPDAGIPDFIDAIQNNSYTYLTSVSGTNVITATATPAPDDYEVGQTFYFIPANTNTGSVTLNISSLGAGSVLLQGNALTGDEILQNVPVEVMVTSAAPTFEIISNGAFLVDQRVDVPSGTKMLFMQNTAPTGWTFASENDDRVILNTDTVGEGGDTGGSWTIDGITIGGTALTEAMLPSLDFTGAANFRPRDSGDLIVSASGSLSTSAGNNQVSLQGSSTQRTSQQLDLSISFGSDEEHDHSFTSDGTWRMAYVKSITCTRD